MKGFTLLSLAAAGSYASAMVYVDTFDAPGDPGSRVFDQVLGGQRDLYVFPSGPSFSVGIQNGTLLAANAGTSSLAANRFVLNYDGIDVSNRYPFDDGPGMNVQLPKTGQFRFVFEQPSGWLELKTTIQTYGRGAAVQTFAVPSGGSEFYLPLNGFEGVNFNDIDRVQFEFTMRSDEQLLLGGIEVVPEPASFLALGAGTLAFIVSRRRKR